MDSPIIPTTNIVAAAMSTANLTIPPGKFMFMKLVCYEFQSYLLQ